MQPVPIVYRVTLLGRNLKHEAIHACFTVVWCPVFKTRKSVSLIIFSHVHALTR